MVAKRLLEPYHMPAVREASGVLIPGAFHPKNDGRKPGGKAMRDPGVAVNLQAGEWKIDAFEEQALAGLSPGVEGARELASGAACCDE